MEPILQSHFVRFKADFELNTGDDKRKEAAAFERFVNYVLLSADYPDAFAGDTELLEVVSVGGADDTFLDGIGVAVNDRLVRSINEINELVESSRKLAVEFVFIQSKMKTAFEITELSNFGTGVKQFFSQSLLPENSKIAEFRTLKDHIYSDEKVISKLSRNPGVRLYFAGTGTEPINEHFTAFRKIIVAELGSHTQCYFDSVSIDIVDGKTLTKRCRELTNRFEVQINIKDIFPLSVDLQADVKKAYAFTCGATEFLKMLRKDDGSLRRSLFNDNVRDYLGNGGAINKEIEETVLSTPEMFLLCNNGVTVVCEEFDQIRDKLVRIENPQIVNGCQTSNTIFSLRSHSNIDRVQLLIRVICTESRSVSNRIVRGTNRQNQVLEEAFEATLPFHQDVLEPFFAACSDPVKLYYERRARQYDNDPLVKRTHIVNLRILTQSFVGMFLDAPHESHRHEAKLLENYAGERGTRKIFRDDHLPGPYFACAVAWYTIEKYLREDLIDRKYRKYKAHILMVLKYATGVPLPKLTKSRALETFCEKLLLLMREPSFGGCLRDVLRVFDGTLAIWTYEGRSPYGIKDNEKFTDLLARQSRERFLTVQPQSQADDDRVPAEGHILRVVWRNGLWFGFISRGAEFDNVYVDSRGFRGDPSLLTPDRRVRFEIKKGPNGLFARNVATLEDALSAEA